MPQTPVEKKIGNNTYILRYLPTSLSLTLFVRLVKMLGPTIGTVFDSDDSEATATRGGGDTFERVGRTLAERLDPAEAQDLMRTLVGRCAVRRPDGTTPELEHPQIFEDHFQGNLFELFRVFAEAMKLNWGANFFDQSQGGVAGLQAIRGSK